MRVWTKSLAVAGCVVATACGSDSAAPGGDAVSAELAAVWVAEPACLPECGFTLASVANPADSVNATAVLGVEVEISMTRAGVFRLTTRPGPPAAQGTVRQEPGMLIVRDAAGVTDTLDYTLAGALLHVQFRRTFQVFDFTGDGVADAARARGSFRRR
jgi:hypothetical protein